MSIEEIRYLSSDSESDSTFISIADMYSLLSFAFIYIAFVIGSSPSANQTFLAQRAVQAGVGTSAPRDNTKAYVSLQPTTDGVAVQVLAIGHKDPYVVGIAFNKEAGEASRIDGLVDMVAAGGSPQEVVIHLPENVVQPEATALFIELARRIENRFSVQLAIK